MVVARRRQGSSPVFKRSTSTLWTRNSSMDPAPPRAAIDPSPRPTPRLLHSGRGGAGPRPRPPLLHGGRSSPHSHAARPPDPTASSSLAHCCSTAAPGQWRLPELPLHRGTDAPSALEPDRLLYTMAAWPDHYFSPAAWALR